MTLHIPEITADTDMLGAALAYAKAGWYILPVKAGTKHPGSILGEHWQHQSSRDPDIIAAWYAGTSCGIALHCGRSGAVVIDLDKPTLFSTELAHHLDNAPYQASRPDDQPGRGHYIFGCPPGRRLGNGTGRLSGGWGEIRGLNGVIIAAPSRHADGGRYHWERAGTVPVLPEQIAALLDDASPGCDAVCDQTARTFIAEHTRAARPELLAGWRKALTSNIASGKSRHNSTLSVVTGAMKEAAVGELDAATALRELRIIFTQAVCRPPAARSAAAADQEWRGIVAWAIGQALTADPADTHARTAAAMGTVIDAAPPCNPAPGAPINAAAALAVFTRWLHLDDPAPVLAVAATVVANLCDGDPVWLLLVGPPSSGKTEILTALTGLDYIVPAATITEAALLSGTPKRDRTTGASGGLLRQIGDFGILLAKDFTSVLSQNKDTARAAVAALREVYDGRWDRPIGADGGRVLHWHGKCGMIGGVVGAYDSYQQIVNSLGDRYLLLRMTDVNPDEQAATALACLDHETQMRAELAQAMTGLIAGADRKAVERKVNPAESAQLAALAKFAARTRTGVLREGYHHEVEVLPQAEGPARIVKALRRIYGGLEAIGVNENNRWNICSRIATDCAPAIRLPVMKALLTANGTPQRTSRIAQQVGMVTKTAHRILEDLALLSIAERSKLSDADNSPDLWSASAWLIDLWPPRVRAKKTNLGVRVSNNGLKNTSEDDTYTPPRTSRSHSEPTCQLCAEPLTNRTSIARGTCTECHLYPPTTPTQ